MKLAAHPMIVAVALGLLDPSALAALDDTPAPRHNGAHAQESETSLALVPEDDDLDELMSELRSVLL